jgi:alkanesulfonate monooxygenase SsuD/methylene tetrahydromethanopterin reductase-like flavin-dependent oxidoreductase (luciferase family)
VHFPPTAERFERLEETLQIALQMWSGDEKPFEGKHYQLARPLNSPQSVQRPHPPILVGGGGERKTLRMVAQYADACNLFVALQDTQHEGLRHKLEVLQEHCQTLGRPYDAIEKTTLSSLHLTRDGRNGTMTPSAAVEAFGRLAELGIDQALFNMANVSEIEPFDLLANEVIPQVEKIAVAGR